MDAGRRSRKSDLPLDLDIHYRTIEVTEGWKYRQIFGPIQEPAKSIRSQRSATLRTCELSGIDFVASGSGKDRPHLRFRHVGQE